MIKFLQQYIQFNEEELEYLSSIGKIKNINKNEHLLTEGKICNFIAYINKGCLRCYFLKDDGTEMTENFSFENQFITDYHSFLTHIPSTQNTIAVEDSELLIISREDIENMYQYGKKFEKLGRMIAENLYIFAYQRIQSLLTEDAEKKYIRLLKNRPDLLNRVQNYHVASYLGISPETLSRIRKKVLFK